MPFPARGMLYCYFVKYISLVSPSTIFMQVERLSRFTVLAVLVWHFIRYSGGGLAVKSLVESLLIGWESPHHVLSLSSLSRGWRALASSPWEIGERRDTRVFIVLTGNRRANICQSNCASAVLRLAWAPLTLILESINQFSQLLVQTTTTMSSQYYLSHLR